MSEDDVKRLIGEFNRAWNEHDVEAALDLVSDDCVFEATPAPDGERFEGKDAVRSAWMPIFDNPNSHFDVEELFVAGDRVIQRWRYQWDQGHVRGCGSLPSRKRQGNREAVLREGMTELDQRRSDTPAEHKDFDKTDETRTFERRRRDQQNLGRRHRSP